MDSAHRLMTRALDGLRPKADYESRKQAYSQDMSAALAGALAEAARQRGMTGAQPDPAGTGTERRMAGGIGAKKVDVTWATEACGLILSASVKTINWRDGGSGTFQKNLTNRRGDLLFEAVTLHRRFPYAVVLGFLFLDAAAQHDGTDRRGSTFANAHQRLALFTGRHDPGGRDEQFERLYVGLIDAQPAGSRADLFAVGAPDTPVSLDDAFDAAVGLVAERNPDFYQAREGRIERV